MDKAQSAVEFMILVGVMLFFSASFILVLQESMHQRLRAEIDGELLEVAFIVREEFGLALEGGEGYQRTLVLPSRVSGELYEMQLVDTLFHIQTSDGQHALAIQVPLASGILVPGTNIIQTVNGTLIVNG